MAIWPVTGLQQRKKKIKGKHTAIIGGHKGQELIEQISYNENIKKVVPGRIQSKGSRVQSGLRVKASAVDERGNIKLILSEGSSNQELYIVTNACSYQEGRQLLQDMII